MWSLTLKYFAERGPLPKGSNKNQEEWKELKYLLSLIDGNPAIPGPSIKSVKGVTSISGKAVYCKPIIT